MKVGMLMEGNRQVSQINFKLRYKSAFVFFVMTFLFNIIFNPILIGLGIQAQLSSFIVNSLGISIAASYVLLVIDQKYRNNKQALLLIGAVNVVSVLSCYYFIFLTSY